MAENTELDNLKRRLRQGDALKSCGYEGGQYVVHLTDDPPLTFDAGVREEVARILHELNQI